LRTAFGPFAPSCSTGPNVNRIHARDPSTTARLPSFPSRVAEAHQIGRSRGKRERSPPFDCEAQRHNHLRFGTDG
jgi:hypothetical protein